MDARDLQGLSLFDGLPPEDVQRIAERAVQVEVPAGKDVVRDAAVAWDFYVIADGNAEVRRGDRTLRTLGPGDFFGEIGVLASDRRRTATVVTTSDVSAIRLSQHDVRAIADEVPAFAERIRAAASERDDTL